MPSMERILEMRGEAFADDVDTRDEMCDWDEERIVRFFEAGGVESTTSLAVQAVSLPVMQRPLRILSMHGGGSNKMLNVMQMNRLKKALGPAEMIAIDYIEGTRKWKDENVDPMIVKMFGAGPYWGWYGVENNSSHDQKDGNAYVAAMMDPSVTFEYFEYEEALDRVEKHMRDHGPYDILAGFSQGGIMATMLTARTLQRGKIPSWSCNLLMSALPPRASPYAPIFPAGGTPTHQQPPIASFPAIVLFGKRDQYFAYGEKGLRSIYGNLRWFDHVGGHETAKEPEVNNKVARAIWQAVGYQFPKGE